MKSLANIGLAMQNICLEALDLCLGSYIVEWFNKEKARKFFNKEENVYEELGFNSKSKMS
jgi:nitroreductase